MIRRAFVVLMLLVPVLGACGVAVKPATAARPVAAGSMDRAMKAAMTAATTNNWVPKTISAETGYILAEREIRVAGRANRPDTYRLEITIPAGGSGSLTAKVTPPPGVVGGESPADMVAKFLTSFAEAVR